MHGDLCQGTSVSPRDGEGHGGSGRAGLYTSGSSPADCAGIRAAFFRSDGWLQSRKGEGTRKSQVFISRTTLSLTAPRHQRAKGSQLQINKIFLEQIRLRTEVPNTLQARVAEQPFISSDCFINYYFGVQKAECN